MQIYIKKTWWIIGDEYALKVNLNYNFDCFIVKELAKKN